VGATLSSIEEECRFQFGHGLERFEAPDPELLRGMLFLTRGAETGVALPESWPVLARRVADTVYFSEGGKVLVNQMLDHLHEKGARIVRSSGLKRIYVDRKKLVGIQLDGNPQVIPTSMAILGTGVDQIKPFLNESIDLQSQPVSWLFQVEFECNADSLPLGMSDHLLYVDAEAPILEIQRTAGTGKITLKVGLPYDESTLNYSYQRRMAERMLKVCEGFIPDLEYNLRRVTPNIRDPERVEREELPRIYPFLDLNRIPESLVHYSAQAGVGSQLPIQNFFVCSEESDPRLGVWGGFKASDEMFAWLEKRKKKTEQS
jgi:hypothetical protein